MKFKLLFLLLFIPCFLLASTNQPKCVKSKNWEFIINNAYRTAEGYSMDKNPAATFISLKKDFYLTKQFGGRFKGKHLLIITNKWGKNTSFAMLLPLFDVNKTTDKLDDSATLWHVVVAKLNGSKF